MDLPLWPLAALIGLLLGWPTDLLADWITRRGRARAERYAAQIAAEERADAERPRAKIATGASALPTEHEAASEAPDPGPSPFAPPPIEEGVPLQATDQVASAPRPTDAVSRFRWTPSPTRRGMVMVVMGALWGLLAWRYGPGLSLTLGGLLLISLALVALAVADLQDRLLPDEGILTGGVLALGLALGRGDWLSALIGAAVGLVLIGLFHLIYPRGLAFGDVTLAGLLGLVLGWPQILWGLVLGTLLGGLIPGLLLLARLATRRSSVPYGPFLIAGALAILLMAPKA